MGKGTDKLYITHSEWSSEDAYGASAGSNAHKTEVIGSNFRKLPFNYCAASLQPFTHPVCTLDGTIFDLSNILTWVKKHGTNPVDGQPLRSSDLIKLHFAKNAAGQYIDPVTNKVLTENTHIVAIRPTGNVFAYDTVERLNVKPKNWVDLVSEKEFKRSDLITLQDPLNVEGKDLSKFKHVQEGNNIVPETSPGINEASLGSAAKILHAKEAAARRKAEREKGICTKKALPPLSSSSSTKPPAVPRANYTTGQTAASFTSTGLTPSTTNARVELTSEEYLLNTPRLVKAPAYVLLQTTHGELTLELQPEHAPRAVWNFLTLAKRRYYDGVAFHRNVPGFMIQGGDPTGTGRGGESCWGGTFADELGGPLKHNARGMVCMANKGKNTNSSQFFITYAPAPHLNRKHTVFGKVVDEEGGTLARLERLEVDAKSKPLERCAMVEVRVLKDPFEEFLRLKEEKEEGAKAKEEDDMYTWTGKRVGGDDVAVEEEVEVGKYLNRKREVDETMASEQPVKKKKQTGGGFGNFDSW
ncbi:cyclophilin-like protein [Piedraia hortae CBS 480.64]|uniref:Peptidyl-prolyl cis-trans isomerase-like 2 n=1 Tax=Piedraia hortae CBS 480.64 TaxID=1314780 RepID=A0A6A7BY82_9PEZI|nr:cyclophilin-like protein [Piedraia hortae CBS 480.64]